MPVQGDLLTIAIVAVVALVAVVLSLRILVDVPGWIQRRRHPEARSIKVIGVGGGGSNAVDRMVAAGIGPVEFVACNTDAQGLRASRARTRLRIGDAITHGLGSGGDPEIGRRAAEENEELIGRALQGSDLVFVTAGLGGGTGSGAAPIVAAIARDRGALTIAVVTKPFAFEGARRERIADASATELAANVDALIVVPNERVSDVVPDDASLADAFAAVDDVLVHAVEGIIDLIRRPGLINLDFADVRGVVQEAGLALIGIGRARGQNRAVDAARVAIGSPLLEASIDGARGILLHISGPRDMTLREVRHAADEVRARADVDANVIFGASYDGDDDEVEITIIATGLTAASPARPAGASVRQPAHATAAAIALPAEIARRAEPVRPAARGRRPANTGPALKPAPGVETPSVETPSVETPALRDRKTAVPNGGTSVRPLNAAPIDDRDLDVPSFLRRRQPPTSSPAR
jgi:cell division protein FtsZ